MKANVVLEKSYQFALEIVALCKQLQELKEFVISKQLLKSGTSIGANVEEAVGGHSKKDFVAKMIIALKEARESNYWLRLLRDSGLSPGDTTGALLLQSEEMIKLLTAIIKTSRSTGTIDN
jgi:four helix bundle protein